MGEWVPPWHWSAEITGFHIWGGLLRKSSEVAVAVKNSKLLHSQTHQQLTCQLTEQRDQSHLKCWVWILPAQSPKKGVISYILLFACSLTRAIHLELLHVPDQTAVGVIRSLKRFIARKTQKNPRKIYSEKSTQTMEAVLQQQQSDRVRWWNRNSFKTNSPTRV